MTDLLTKLFYGPRRAGERLTEPRKFPIRNTTDAEWQEWAREFNFGTRYGHRGSFYQNKFQQTVASYATK